MRLPESTPRPHNVGVLLAAGAGRRYGKPKVLVDGWLDIAVGALRDGGCADVVVVLGAAEVAAPPGVTVVTAPQWHEGLSASVRTGLAEADRMHADYAVLHVIDTPDVGPPWWRGSWAVRWRLAVVWRAHISAPGRDIRSSSRAGTGPRCWPRFPEIRARGHICGPGRTSRSSTAATSPAATTSTSPHKAQKPSESQAQQLLGVAMADARAVVVGEGQIVQECACRSHGPEGVVGREGHSANTDLRDQVGVGRFVVEVGEGVVEVTSKTGP